MDVISIPYGYVASLCWNLRRPDVFAEVDTFVMFIGYPRSGHSLIGFLLDAHPNAIVASQKSALKYLKHGFSREQIFYMLWQNSRRVARVGREWRPFSYAVPNQWQGRFERLRVIGDTTGLTRMRRDPRMLNSLRAKLGGIELKLIHCIRNPYDNISTMSLSSGETLGAAVERYFWMCGIVARILQEVPPSTVYHLRHESLIADSQPTLRDLTGFFGLSATDAYYQDCAGIIYKSPNKSRLKVDWTAELIDDVRERAQRYSYLRDYSYDS